MFEIERSNQRGKFSVQEIRAKVAESKKFWNSPEGKAERRRLDLEAERRRKNPKGIKFPELAKRGTRPAITGRDEVLFHNVI